MEEKYELVKNDYIEYCGHKLYRIRSHKTFHAESEGKYVHCGDLGGYIEKESNLSHFGDCWVYDNAKVFGGAIVFNDARILDNAIVCDNAKVFNDSTIFNNAKIYGDATVHCGGRVFDNACVFGKAEIIGDALVHGNAKVFDNAILIGCADLFGNAKVFGDAAIFNKVQICDDAEIFDGASISDGVIVYGNSKIFGESVLRGKSTFNNAYIGSSNDYLLVGPIYKNDFVTFYKTNRNGIYVFSDIFNGSIKDFNAELDKMDIDDESLNNYRSIIDMANKIIKEV